MAQLNVSLVLIFLSIFCITGTVESAGIRSRNRAYIEAQCQSTRYPELCVKSLSEYVNSTARSPQQLAQLSLTVSLTKARNARAFMARVVTQLKQSKDMDYQPVKDCIAQINDGVDQLTQSIKELQLMGQSGPDKFMWHQNNVLTWVSAALTDVNTCVDGFSGRAAMGGKLRATIKAMVLNVAQLTSNALVLFHRFAAWQRVTGARKP
ncbi:pectinesterase inhibitor 9-like [Cornus florida]|uniref:pectinesterase inhibitor 9-like n=1 Tax=Cornus florida TaxID=4283 RepID=UPI0028A06E2D|nr:pectinesterase inhibitor 9-like [Cornus florida]